MIDPTTKVTAVNEFRMQYLRLYYGATDAMSDSSVPADRRDEFLADVQYNREYAERWLERLCKRFGATDGTWSTVPEDNQADALRQIGGKLADYQNRCEFELDLLKIDLQEQADNEVLDFG